MTFDFKDSFFEAVSVGNSGEIGRAVVVDFLIGEGIVREDSFGDLVIVLEGDLYEIIFLIM